MVFLYAYFSVSVLLPADFLHWHHLQRKFCFGFLTHYVKNCYEKGEQKRNLFTDIFSLLFLNMFIVLTIILFIL